MFVYILRRLSQTALVLAITSLLVFGGLYLVGDPVEILVNPSADQIEKERAAVLLSVEKERAAILQDVDRIVVLHHGRVRETGTHAELLARPGVPVEPAAIAGHGSDGNDAAGFARLQDRRDQPVGTRPHDGWEGRIRRGVVFGKGRSDDSAGCNRTSPSSSE